MIPDHISYYRIVRPLGAGAMGEVYVAEDMRLGRNVAVKVLPSRFTTDPDRVRRFEQEARAASALNHPNIITIYDIGEDAHSRFIAMELVEGRTLRALVGEPMPLPQLLSIGRQIAQALHVAHQAGIVHRDIKPENVMVRDDGYVKVLDFGLARLGSLHGGDHTAATLSATSPGTLLGTARYMSPEQARGETVSGASDVFALGTMLYELATGRHPVEATNLVEVLQAVASQPPAIPSALVRDLPPWLDALLLDLLEKDVQHRPTARDVDTILSQAGRSSSPERLDSPPSTSGSRASVRTRSIVGRERERLALQSAFESVASGRGLMVGVAGEPGIGKTTLVEEFVAALTADRERCRIGRGRCSERLAGTEAYLPWLEALDSLRSERGRAAAADTRTMRQLRTIAPTWHSQLVPQGTDAHADAAAHAVRAASQERLKREMGALLEELSREQPLLLFFDDLHWADVSTIDLLAFVASRFSSMPVLIVATYRPSDLALTRHPFLQIKPDLQSRGLCRELALEFLNRSELTAYLDLEFPGHTFPAEFGALVHAKTEGSPLFMADLLRDLRDRGVITRHDNGWQLSQTLQAVQSDLPESMRGMVERKIGQLSDDDRRLLAAASVQGVQFEAAIVARALDVDESSVEERLEILERAYALVRCVRRSSSRTGA